MNALLKENIKINVEVLNKFTAIDLADLCNISEQAIKAGGGFGWLEIPPRTHLKKYWNGLILIEYKKLIVGRMNEAIAGALQLSFQPPNNEAQKNIAQIQSHFVAPWARGYGLAKSMIDYTEKVSKENNAECLQLDIRKTQTAAIQLFKSKGFIQWGENPCYAFIDKKFIKGLYFYKKI
tara:strand:+ start:514 stop:1050 length:537 start_codon:yes stop_codon:yes gene_type:complete